MVIDVRPVLGFVGLLLCALGTAMLLPAAIDAHDGHAEAGVFVISAGITLGAGLALVLGMRTPHRVWTTRQTYLAVVAGWMVPPLFAALPMALGGAQMSGVDAVFEAVSGLTTTGATVLVGLDHAPRGLLLWRALLNWLGGLGVVTMAVAVLPTLAVGGMQMFHLEIRGPSDRAPARGHRIAGAIFAAYAGMTMLLALGLWLAGLGRFEAAAHALSTLSTGGFSTSDDSLGHFRNPLAEMIVIAGMVAGGLPFLLFYRLLRGDVVSVFRDSQVRWYLGLLALGGGAIAAWLWASLDQSPLDALRHGAFTVASVLTGTGFYTLPHAEWGGMPAVILFFLAVVGGCAGSTSGGLKVFRFQCLLADAVMQLRRLLRPHAVLSATYNRVTIPEEVLESVMGFLFVFALAFAFLAMALAGFGLDFVSAINASIAALTNLGPGPAGAIAGGGGYGAIPDGAKILLSLGMVLGRLEIFAVLVLFVPAFWRP